MGWTSFNDMPGLTANEILIRETSGKNDSGAEWQIIDSATKSNEWYAVCKFTAPGNDPIYYGLVCIFRRSKKSGEFSYKDMAETCGPNASRAPLRIVDMLDKLDPIDPADMRQSAQWALQWRARCRENAKRKPAPKVKPGDIVKFSDNGREFELISPAGPRLGWYVKLHGALNVQLYRAKACQVSKCQIIKG